MGVKPGDGRVAVIEKGVKFFLMGQVVLRADGDVG